MTVKELKELLKEVPDSTEIRFVVGGSLNCTTEIPIHHSFSPETGFETEYEDYPVELEIDNHPADLDFVDIDESVNIGITI